MTDDAFERAAFGYAQAAANTLSIQVAAPEVDESRMFVERSRNGG